MIELLSNSPAYLFTCVFLFGLIWGSFLNVVIYRLPLMVEKDFKSQAIYYLKQDKEFANILNDKDEEDSETFNLVLPNSSCPHCGHEIKATENIPVLSYLFLGGKCSQCKTKISSRYPIVELSTAVVSVILAWKFGFSYALLSSLVLSYGLICLSLIDFDTQLLLDSITFPLLWLGLLVNYFEVFTTLENAVLGAVAGYMSLWSVFWLYKITTGKHGMGYGDFKLLALLGAWLGWQAVPLIILLSSLTGAVIGGIYLLTAGKDRNQTIPFGPYLSAAGWIALIWGQDISQAYFNVSGL